MHLDILQVEFYNSPSSLNVAFTRHCSNYPTCKMSEGGRSKTETPAGGSTASGMAGVSPKPDLSESQRQSPAQTETPRTQDGNEYPSVAGTVKLTDSSYYLM